MLVMLGGRNMKSKSLLIIAGLVLTLSLAGVAYAERWVVVNRTRLTIPQIEALERVHCGPIPNGHYWLDFRTGIWGYAGDPRSQGHIKDNCYRPERRPSLSERGLLFTPGDFIR